MTTAHHEHEQGPAPSSSTRTSEGGDDFGARALVDGLRRSFDSGRTRSAAWRIEQLRALRRMVKEREDEILDALHADVGKPPLEGYTTEVGYTIGAIDHTLKHLAKWMAPEKVTTTLVAQPGSSRIHKEPLGVVLIIAPWNYPFQLAVGPLIGAIAAGNCAVIKPSEVTPAISTLLSRLVPEYLDGSAIRVFEGAVPETTALLEQRFDHIFYTGNGAVARIVMAAAAKHLTPVTLELGGKSPCIVARDANVSVAARRIAFGKWTNAGQTCVAPDYVLAHRDIHDALVAEIAKAIADFYGEDPQRSKDYGRVVNERHHRRLMALMDSGRVAAGGQADERDRYIAPTVLTDVEPDAPIMQDEIFGPILPVLKIGDVEEAIRFVNARPKPLALYVFTEDDTTARDVVARTTSGGLTVNHIWLHLAVHDLPFGGVGESGMGAYHGQASFDTFSHRKAVLSKPTRLDPSIMYPPYTGFKETILKKLV